MDSDLSFFLVAGSLVGLGGGLWLLVHGFGAYRSATRLVDTATSTISSLAVGEVRVSGVVVPAELTLLSPLQSETCVYYRSRVREGDGSGGRTVLDEERAVGFRVVDASGEVRVFPRSAAFDVPLCFDDADDELGSPPGLALRYGPAVQPATPDSETIVARLLTVRPGLGVAGASGLFGIPPPGDSALSGGVSTDPSPLVSSGPLGLMTSRGPRDYEEARIQPGESVTIVGTALPFDQLPDPDGADLVEGGDGCPGAMVAHVASGTPNRADLAAARAAGILDRPSRAWGNAAIPGFGIGQPVREPALAPDARPLPIADASVAERFERTFEIDPGALVLAAAADRPLLISAGAPAAAVARLEDRFMLGLLGAVVAILSAVVLALQLGGLT
jgi:hypothetical protein